MDALTWGLIIVVSGLLLLTAWAALAPIPANAPQPAADAVDTVDAEILAIRTALGATSVNSGKTKGRVYRRLRGGGVFLEEWDNTAPS